MKKIITLLLIFVLSTNLTCAIAAEGVGNKIITEEFPDSSKVAPFIEGSAVNDNTFVIEGSVEKSIDITLNECLKFSLGNNPRIRAAINDILASDARVAQTWSNYFPKLNWQTGYTRVRQLQLSDVFGQNLVFNYFILGQITLSQMLYDFGVTQNQVTIKKLDYEGYKTTLTGTINDVIYQTKDAYYNLLYAYDRKKVAEDTVAKFELFYNQAKAFYEIGMNPKVDVTISEVNLSNAKLQLIQADNAIDLAIAQLNNVMGLPYVNRYNVQERLRYTPIELPLNEVMEIAKESRPELQLAEIKVEAANQNIKLTKKAYYPQLLAEGQYQIGGKSFTSNYGYNLGAYLNFPVMNGMLIKNQIKEAKYLYDRELANAQNTKNNIYLEIQNAYLMLFEKKNQMPVAFLGVKQAKESYELSYGRYRVGEGSPTELKDSQIAYQQSQLNYYNALYQYNSAKAQLEKAIGKNLVGAEETSIDFEP